MYYITIVDIYLRCSIADVFDARYKYMYINDRKKIVAAILEWFIKRFDRKRPSNHSNFLNKQTIRIEHLVLVYSCPLFASRFILP